MSLLFTDNTKEIILRIKLEIEVLYFCTTRCTTNTMVRKVTIVQQQLDTLENFLDRGEVSDWAKEAMQWAVTKGILNGTIWGIERPRPSIFF